VNRCRSFVVFSYITRLIAARRHSAFTKINPNIEIGVDMPTNQDIFDPVDDVLRQGNKIFVIPVFQRPYAWEEIHIKQLLDDIDTGSKRRPTPAHYLSPIHLVPIRNPKQKEWIYYVDQSNDDVIALNQTDFTSDENGQRGTIRVYMVIDGQQRLTTLFNLFWNMNPAKLTINCNGRMIPRIILNPVNDHYAFRKMLSLPTSPPSAISKSQKRLAYCLSQSIGDEYWRFVTSREFTLLQVELNEHYALQAFQTQNDRGKYLTTIEKLKSLIMEYDLSLGSGLVHRTHKIFGMVYQTLDKPSCYCTEDEFVQLLSIFARIHNNRDCLDQAAEAAYKAYFLTEPKTNVNGPKLLSGWINTASGISNQLDRLDHLLVSPRTLPSCIMPSVAKRTVTDDYAAILKSLRLNVRCVAVLCKIGELFPDIEWHDKAATVLTNNTTVVPVLSRRLTAAKGLAHQGLPEVVIDRIQSLEDRIKALSKSVTKEISALEVVERIQLFTLSMGHPYPGGFKDYWNAYFKPGNTIQNILKGWYEFATMNFTDNRTRFIDSLFERFINNEVKKYVLREYEYAAYGDNIHFNNGLHIEHIFPENPTSKPPLDYFPSTLTSIDYDGYIALLGNHIYLDGSLNESIRNHLPPIKAAAYATQSHNSIVVPADNQVKSSIAVGNDFSLIGNLQHFRTYIDLRAVELAVFAAERFF